MGDLVNSIPPYPITDEGNDVLDQREWLWDRLHEAMGFIVHLQTAADYTDEFIETRFGGLDALRKAISEARK